jgi:hypothetical protein
MGANGSQRGASDVSEHAGVAVCFIAGISRVAIIDGALAAARSPRSTAVAVFLTRRCRPSGTPTAPDPDS